MKIIACILSVYILVLTVKPCDDVPGMRLVPGINIDFDSHHHDYDSCSPFCVCQCCQAHVFVTIPQDLSCFEDFIPNHTYYNLSIPSRALSDFLIPPEFS